MGDTHRDGTREDAARRRARILDLRREGKTFQQIGDEIGISRQRVHELFKEALAEIPAQSVSEYRAEQEQLLDELRTRAFDVLAREHVTVSQGRVVVDPDTGGPIVDDAPRLRAIETVLKIEERLARLRGIDVPTRAQVEGSLQVRYVVEGVDPGEALT